MKHDFLEMTLPTEYVDRNLPYKRYKYVNFRINLKYPRHRNDLKSNFGNMLFILDQLKTSQRLKSLSIEIMSGMEMIPMNFMKKLTEMIVMNKKNLKFFKLKNFNYETYSNNYREFCLDEYNELRENNEMELEDKLNNNEHHGTFFYTTILKNKTRNKLYENAELTFHSFMESFKWNTHLEDIFIPFLKYPEYKSFNINNNNLKRISFQLLSMNEVFDKYFTSIRYRSGYNMNTPELNQPLDILEERHGRIEILDYLMDYIEKNMDIKINLHFKISTNKFFRSHNQQIESMDRDDNSDEGDSWYMNFSSINRQLDNIDNMNRILGEYIERIKKRQREYFFNIIIGKEVPQYIYDKINSNSRVQYLKSIKNGNDLIISNILSYSNESMGNINISILSVTKSDKTRQCISFNKINTNVTI